MKLIIQIPCLNEAEWLPAAFAALPRRLEGFDIVEIMVIDDGSSDETAAVARRLGVDHVVRLDGHRGLARAFTAGLTAAAEQGADVIVNTDADNQYDARDIERLVRPILEHRAEMVIGARPIQTIQHFSWLKRLCERLGSFFVRTISGAAVPDAPSGFRAMTRDAALRLQVFNDFTYTIETIVQAHLTHLRVLSVPVRINARTRPSRLFRTSLHYVLRGTLTMLHAYTVYRPGHVFGLASAAFLLGGVLLGGRYLLLMAEGEGQGHVQSVIACAVLLLCGVFMGAIAMLAHLQGINRRLLEEVRFLLRRQMVPSPHSEGRERGISYTTADAGDGTISDYQPALTRGKESSESIGKRS